MGLNHFCSSNRECFLESNAQEGLNPVVIYAFVFQEKVSNDKELGCLRFIKEKGCEGMCHRVV